MWNLISGSAYLQEYENYERFRKLHNALIATKSVVAVTAPVKPKFFEENKKQRQLRRLEMDRVYQENKILLKKLDDIEGRRKSDPRLYPSKRSQFVVSNNRYPINDDLKHNKFKNTKVRQICDENLMLALKLKNVRPHYSHKKLEREAITNSAYLTNISRNVTKPYRFPQPYDMELQSPDKHISKRLGTAKSTVSRSMSASHTNLRSPQNRPHTSSFRNPTYANIKPRLPSSSIRRQHKTLTQANELEPEELVTQT